MKMNVMSELFQTTQKRSRQQRQHHQHHHHRCRVEIVNMAMAMPECRKRVYIDSAQLHSVSGECM